MILQNVRKSNNAFAIAREPLFFYVHFCHCVWYMGKILYILSTGILKRLSTYPVKPSLPVLTSFTSFTIQKEYFPLSMKTTMNPSRLRHSIRVRIVWISFSKDRRPFPCFADVSSVLLPREGGCSSRREVIERRRWLLSSS